MMELSIIFVGILWLHTLCIGGNMLEKIFHLKAKNTDVKTEVLAGCTTFLAMAYILFVNPSILSESGMNAQSVFLATAIASFIASVLMGLLANYPVALSSGMGVNALFTYTVCIQFGYSWQAALACVFISGLIFVLISITGIRKLIINSIPKNLKLAIGAGIGFFIAFIGFANAGIVVSNPSTIVSLGNMLDPTVILALIGLVITIVLMVKKVNAAVFWGIVITTIIGLIMSAFGLEGMPVIPETVISFNFEMPTFMAFMEGFGEVFSDPRSIVIIFTFLFVDFFDTAGTLVAVGNNIGLVNENGEMENVEKALLADSIGTVVGACLGTSTVTSFVESGSGVAAGGRTGLTACTTGILFLLSIFFSPILVMVTSSITAPALIVVGIMMSMQLGQIEWNLNNAIFAFTTVIMMVLCYSISDGIAFGFLTYTISKLANKEAKDIKPIIYILDIIFIIYFITK